MVESEDFSSKQATGSTTQIQNTSFPTRSWADFSFHLLGFWHFRRFVEILPFYHKVRKWGGQPIIRSPESYKVRTWTECTAHTFVTHKSNKQVNHWRQRNRLTIKFTLQGNVALLMLSREDKQVCKIGPATFGQKCPTIVVIILFRVF